MRRLSKRAGILAGFGGLLALLALPATAQDEGGAFRLSGVFEHYFGGKLSGSTLDADLATRWIQVKGETAGGLGFTAGIFHKPTFKALDENYLELNRGGRQWRAGRIRSGFGLASWDDQWYNGFASQPLMRVTRFAPGFMLSRFDTGADFQGGGATLEYRVGVVDVTAGRNDVLARRPDHLVARLQTFQAGVVLGFSALANPREAGTELFNLDWRWSSPQWIVRGELLGGRVKGRTAAGHYLDLYYHPIRRFRTTLIARAEESANMPGFGESPGSGYEIPGSAPPESAPRSRMLTLGVKQILSREITLSATHGWGNRSANLRGAIGWSFQAIHFLRF